MVMFHSFLYVFCMFSQRATGFHLQPTARFPRRASRRMRRASRKAPASLSTGTRSTSSSFKLVAPPGTMAINQPTNQPTKRLVKAKPAQKLEILKRVFSWLSINQCILQQKNKVLNYLCLWHSVRGKIILKKSWESYHGWCFWSCFQESSNQKWYWAITNRC